MFGDADNTKPLSDCIGTTFPGEWGEDDSDGSGVNIIRTTNFTNSGKLDLTNVVTRKIDQAKIDKKHLIPGDIILERSGGTADNPVGRVVYFEADGTFLFNNFTQLLRCKDGVNSLFVFYSLYNYYHTHKNEIRSMGNKTTGIQNLKMDKYWDIPIADAPPEKQEQFVSLYKQADKSKFNGFKSRFIELFGDPFRNEKGWAYNSLLKMTTIVLGTTPSSSNPDYWDGDIKWITPAELNDDSFYVYDSERHITEAGVQSTTLKSFPAGTVIFSTRAPIGKTAIAGCEMYCNQGFKNFICSDRLNPVYLFFTLRSHKVELQKMGTGSTFLELSKKTIEGLSISTPPRELQDEFEVIYKQADKSKYLS